MGKEMEDRKVGELTLGFELKGVDEPQPRLDEAAGHIAAACEILVSLAGGVEIGADVIVRYDVPQRGQLIGGSGGRGCPT